MDKRGKTAVLVIISLLIASFLLFDFIQADDLKVYDKETKTVTIKNDTGSEIITIKLLTPLDNQVHRGYGVVAEYEINSLESLKILISKMELFDKEDSMKSISRSIDYKIKGTESVEVNDYVQDCKDVIKTNGTIVQECTKKLSGSHFEDRVVWNDLNKVDFI